MLERLTPEEKVLIEIAKSQGDGIFDSLKKSKDPRMRALGDRLSEQNRDIWEKYPAIRRCLIGAEDITITIQKHYREDVMLGDKRPSSLATLKLERVIGHERDQGGFAVIYEGFK